ncbi:MAG TPA: glycogen debranching enzyme N-terminal domain-containing protein, partial [Polyangia bacterium]|nr:glycogen debranching enzyme N-terminal domain-containing protein [Polyangia bacterium]
MTIDNRDREWLETDGLGGFASGTVAGVRTRRYHGLLVTPMTPPTGRMLLVAGLDVTVETPGGHWMLSTQRYAPDVTGGDGEQHIESFALQPWPTWVFRLPDGTRIQHEVVMRAGAPQVFLSWRLLSASRAPRPAPDLAWTKVTVRPFLAGRDFHARWAKASRSSSRGSCSPASAAFSTTVPLPESSEINTSRPLPTSAGSMCSKVCAS